ncbi:hypothetical protein E7T06_14395 [Deinococcus sp. Arct2-2]|nr:hypothetical protein E7T06_14395 [Deinococcus sp. Arct2-2]
MDTSGDCKTPLMYTPGVI